MRAFVAVDLDPEIKDSLSKLINRLSRIEADIRWVKKQGMHITLKFLGEVPESKIPGIVQAIRKACNCRNSFHLSFKGTGFFPPQSRFPRVLWAGIEQSPDLFALHKKIEDEFKKLGFPKENRRFHPHLTLGRVKTNKNITSVLEELEDHKELIFGNMQTERVTLFRSTLKPTGAVYDVLSDIQLT
jgi:2'-5' RNA ligase